MANKVKSWTPEQAADISLNDKDSIVLFKNVTKTFNNGKLIANDNVSFGVINNTIHAIIGENGAGKSTLLSMLFGLKTPTSGSIHVFGKKANYKSASDAMDNGLGMVQQHFQLIDKFTVGESILLGKETTKYGFLSLDEEFKKINELSKKYNFGIKHDQKISSLTVGQRQRVEILKLLYLDSQILIFDEPTASLTPDEIKALLDIIVDLKKKGKTIILVTHKLDEIKAVADFATVLRKGKMIGNVSAKTLTPEKMSYLMVGREIHQFKKEKTKPGSVALKLEDVSVKHGSVNKLNSMSLELHRGEILAVAGVEGNGQSYLAHAISGIVKPNSGTIKVISDNNEETLVNNASVKKMNELVSIVEEDRHKWGSFEEMRCYENFFMKNFSKKYSRFGFLNKTKMMIDASKFIEQYDVRGADGGKALFSSLSGGNQQKLVIAREMENDNDVLVIFQATRGLDVGAIENVHKQIIKAKKENKAILLISYDLDEIVKLADRVIVMNSGTKTGTVPFEKISKENIGLYMSITQNEGGAQNAK